MGTYRGLVRFNGIDFTLFAGANTGGLIEGKVRDLTVSHQGELLVASSGGSGVTIYANGRFRAAGDRNAAGSALGPHGAPDVRRGAVDWHVFKRIGAGT